MNYYYSKKAITDFNKAPMRRLVGFALGLMVVLLLIFLSPDDKKHHTFYTMSIVLGLLYIFLLKSDLLHVLSIKKTQFHDLTVSIDNHKLSFIYENYQSSVNLSEVKKAKLFYKKGKLKSISLYLKNKVLIVLNDDFDKLDLMLIELQDLIGNDKFNRSKLFHQI